MTNVEESQRRLLRKRKYQAEPDSHKVPILANDIKPSLILTPPREREEQVILPDDDLSDLTEVEEVDAEAINATKALIYSVYEDVWKDFYDWENQYCNTILRFLDTESTIHEDETADFLGSESWDGLRASSIYESVQVLEYIKQGPVKSIKKSYTITAPVVEPHDAYESCSPTDRSIFVGDDADELPFLPFADDPSFNVKNYCEQFTAFAWEKDSNSDRECLCVVITFYSKISLVEMIALEAMSRLHFYHDVSVADLGETQLFPRSYKGSRYIEDFLSHLHYRYVTLQTNHS